MRGSGGFGAAHCSICATALSSRHAEASHPNVVCHSCVSRVEAVNGSGYPTIVTIEGIRCWQVDAGDTVLTLRDATDAGSFEAFRAAHYTADGSPLQWFAPGPDGEAVTIRAHPDTYADLRSFFDRFPPTTIYRFDGVDRDPVAIAGPSKLHPEAAGLTAPPTMEAITVTESPERCRFTAESTRSVVVLGPEERPDLTGVGSKSARVDRLRAFAAVAPVIVDRSALHDLCTDDDPAVRYGAMRALAAVVAFDPTVGLGFISELRTLLRSEQHPTRLYALRSLACLAEAYPDAVEHLTDAVIDELAGGHELIDAAATRFLLHISEYEPYAALEGLSKLESVVSTQPTRTGKQALAAIGNIAQRYPDAVRPIVPTLCESLVTEDTRYQISGTTALGRVTSVYPAAATPIVPLVLDLLDAAEPELRGNAVGILADIAQEYPTDVAPYAADIAPLLSDPDAATRSNAVGALARIASVKPARIEQYVPTLTALLSDEWAHSRIHACWALGYCRADDAAAELRAVRAQDPSDAARDRAAWALSRL